jgi:GT2 family glycosyltransferase/predicted SAM-dependent methyltransferase
MDGSLIMEILVLAYHIKNEGGGSARFMLTVADCLVEMGHTVTVSNEPEKCVDKKFDLIICSHLLHRIKKNPAFKICISHGLVNDEILYPGADRYISITPEVKSHNLKYGVYSEVIPQPIQVHKTPILFNSAIKPPNEELKNILVIRRHKNKPCPFAFLGEKYNLKYSDPNKPIEDQIKWADLCITLGRGALESMAYGRPVLVADNREYMGPLGDGYVTVLNIDEIAKHNFSGRRHRHQLTKEWIEGEIAKYDSEDTSFLHQYVLYHHEAKKITGEYLKMGEKKESQVTEGLISIVIPVFNKHEMSQDCIQAVMDTTEQPYEIIVVDNGSDPPFTPQFTGFNELRLIRNDENKGFPIAVNQGIRESNGEYIVLLNNDVTVTPGSINNIVEWLDEFDIVGPITNYAAGFQQVQIESYHNIDELYKSAEFIAESSEGESQEVNWIIGFCMAFKRSLYDEIGQFDEALWPCSGEEISFCLAAKEKGYSVGIAFDTYVHHEGSETFKDLEHDGVLEYEKVCAKTDAYLKEKWGHDFWNHQAIDHNPESVPVKGINLNLGCGYAKLPEYINIDNRAEVKPDLVCDVLEGLPYEDNSVDMIRAHDFLEHIPIGKTIDAMNEIWRVLKPGGILDTFTPDAEVGQGAFQDPTHVSFWVENSWKYYSEPIHRNLYGIKAHFEIKTLERIESENRVCHLRVIAEAVKGGS